ncbi:DUF4347 domain-containing protein, partial [Spiribacter onubensis]
MDSSDKYEALVIDASVEEMDTLLAGLSSSVRAPRLVARDDDPAQSIRHFLDDPSVTSLHVLGHGRPGGVRIGSRWLTAEDFRVGADTAAARPEPLEIYFWSCHTGADAAGRTFMQNIAEHSMANVFASTDLTGDKDQGGNWELNASATPRAAVPFSQEARDAFGVVLATVELNGSSSETERTVTSVNGSAVALADPQAALITTSASQITSLEVSFDNSSVNSNEQLNIAGSINESIALDVSASSNNTLGEGAKGTYAYDVSVDSGANTTKVTFQLSGGGALSVEQAEEILSALQYEDTGSSNNGRVFTIKANTLGETDTGATATVAAATDSDDSISGAAGDDLLAGGAGSDTLTGGAGDDTFQFADGAALSGDTSVSGGAGEDTIVFTSAATDIDDADFSGVSDVEAITLADGTNTVTLGANASGSGIDSITGGTGADNITGSSAAETIAGGDSGDTITGGAGSDTLTGGAGDDTFQFADGAALSGDTSVSGGAGEDTIVFTSAATDIDDADFSGVSDVEAITLA